MDEAEFRSVILDAEFEEVRRRRASIDDDRPGIAATDPYAADLTGLALSGGGIRSSTLSLGAIQALAREGVLSGVDYLSTVSGGGFVGGCLSSVLNDPSTSAGGPDFPLKENLGGSESPELTQLRNSGKYLGPTGFFEKLRIPALLIRGMLINLFLLAPLIVLAVFLTELWAEHVSHAEASLRRVIEWATVAFFILGLIPPYFSYIFVKRFNWRSRQRYEYFFIFFLVLAASGLAFYPISLAIEFAVDISWGQLIYQILRRVTLTTDSQLFWVFTAVVVLILVAAGRASQDLAKLRNRALMYVVGLLGPGIIFLIYALLCVWQIDSAYIPLKNQYYLTQEDIDYLHRGLLSDTLAREMQAESQPLAALPHHGDGEAVVAILTRLGDDPRCEVPLLNLFGGSKRNDPDGEDMESWSDCWRLESGEYHYLLRLEDRDLHVFNQWIPEDLAQDGQPMGDALRGFLADKNVELGPGTYITSWSEIGGHEICVPREATPTSCEGASRLTTLFPRSHHRLEIMPHPVQILDSYDWWFYGGAIVLLLLNIIFVNVNFTSLHGFYRDQLTRGFLFRRTDSAQRDFGRRVRLSELNQPDTKAPYHIVNVTLNLQASDDEDLRGRGAGFFIFSKHWVGGERTGYVPTETMERVDAHLDLGTAMAISGGAASPNAGSYDFGPLVFIMTMLNLRLDYWLPNPAKLAKTNFLGRLWLQRGAGPVYVLREAVSALDERHSFVNLSDGGHLENMGIYQLLRRRCRRIICVDGEEDSAMLCAGLVKLIRLAAIDLGIVIRIDLSGFAPSAGGNSASHFAVGEIDYGNGETGTLYYLKASMTGDENPYVTEYRQRYGCFPHESTAEQFFTEEQFEAYRALGNHMATQLIAARPELRVAPAAT
jgi:hypothetical protein